MTIEIFQKDIFPCFFYILKKEEFLTPERKKEIELFLSHFKLQEKFLDQNESMHSDRRLEYILGRYSAYCLFKDNFQLKIDSLDSASDRSPQWPLGFVGSITHNKNWVAAVVVANNQVQGVGIDIEILGRTKASLKKHITIDEDLKVHPHFTEVELLTFLFSAKESLYKALYPKVLKYFGFDSAFVHSIDYEKKTFSIHLKKELSDSFGPNSQCIFQGRFLVVENSILTFISF